MRPTSLHMVNFLSHQDTQIEFPASGILNITGDNGAGKSSILDSITWAVWGKSRTSVRDTNALIFRGATYMSVTLEFEINYQSGIRRKFRVFRRRDIDESGKPSTVLSVEEYNDAWQEIGDHTIRGTQATIEEVVGMSYETFLCSPYLQQDGADLFTQKTPAEKKQLLFQFLGLDVWEERLDKARDKHRDAKVQVESLELQLRRTQDEARNVDAIEHRLHEREQRIERLVARETQLVETHESLQELLQHAEQRAVLESRIAEQRQDLQDAEVQRETLANRQSQLTGVLSIAQTIREKAREYTNLTEQNEELHVQAQAARRVEEKRAAIRAQIEEKRHTFQQQLQQKKSQVRMLRQEIKNKQRERQTRVAHLRELLSQTQVELWEGFGSDLENHTELVRDEGNKTLIKSAKYTQHAFDTTLAEHKENSNDPDRIRKQIKELERTTDDSLVAELAQAQAELQTIEAQCESENYLRDLFAELSALHTDYDEQAHARVQDRIHKLAPWVEKLQLLRNAETQNAEITERCTEVAARVTRIKHRIAELTVQRDELPEMEGAEQRTQETRRALQETRTELARQRTELGAQRNALSEARKNEAIAQRTQRQLNWWRVQAGVLEFLKEAFGVRGIPALILEHILPEFESEVNEVLGVLSNNTMEVRLESQRETQAGDKQETLRIIISNEGRDRPYETFSGSEKFRFNFALRVGLARLLANRAGVQLRSLLIDEAFSSLDDQRETMMVETVRRLLDFFDFIVIITHDQELRDSFPNKLHVVKEGRVSAVRWGENVV